MQTLYIDVYFLINFTVDLLALYFAVSIVKLPTTLARLLISSAIGAATAILNLFIGIEWLGYLILLIGFLSMIMLSTKRVTLYRRFKLAFCFSMLEMLLGGAVYFVYGFLDQHIGYGDQPLGGSEHRGLLILAILVLLSIGVFKCLVSLFSFAAGSETVEVELRSCGRRLVAEALVDSGNLAKDPFDMRAVMLVSEEIAGRLLGEVPCLDGLDQRDGNLIGRIRLIPVSFGKERRLLLGFRPDAVYVITSRGREEIDVIVAIDKEGGKYGGTGILMPAVAVRDVI